MADTAELIFQKHGKFFLTSEEVADLLGLGLKSFQTMLSDGTIGIAKRHKGKRFHFRDVAAYVDSQQISGSPVDREALRKIPR